ncbi:DUF4880 domain-containing protein [Pseudoalteromonas luteoviolacea]|uniref:FecR N-terminal domain-containing protein n=1 Tax=Pseudoalteromonas luteoviolacea S4054 TaxID=1129367 RepID=A0A0F6AB23_9GAMM|nr:DUF4880 domain-containing protein [Pseudoalteromonas luteoviolacea]AOT07063.1 hypothetical protein S4054249_03880 [Pseudoalteromonas luteoviolacea]AOT11981.1 hypothetical protein S40542_03880 [Pseudoalteromonas luteoviolacea]AOT16893.1 hypothetical protein S4054_03880 [Pseudoalteromonas luteoviolacea]KKE82609.1 hypothetical protein N479_17515 [Pseudoalteromonas luteoviolacea S4054]KZN69957.1 hypothetical protein N481_21310 [Pseudoalteromonas luteoviolacea S4047-1]
MSQFETMPTQSAIKQAIKWYVQHEAQSLTRTQKQAFTQWLEEDPTHQKAWLQVQRSQQMFSGLQLDGQQSLNTLSKAQHSRRHILKSIAVISISSGLTWRYQKELGISAKLADHHAQVGEQVKLSDLRQAEVHLNTHSAINLSATALQLKYGEAHVVCQISLIISSPQCHLEAPEGSEFILFDEGGQLRFSALNQQFNIYTNGQYYQVARGNTLISDHTGARIISTPRHATSWTKGMLSVSQMPLEQFISELSRYLSGSIRVAPAAAQLRISGAFSLEAPKQILRQIINTFPELTLTGIPSVWQVINKN